MVTPTLSSATPFTSAAEQQPRGLRGGATAAAVDVADKVNEDSTQFYGGYTPFFRV